MNAFAVFQEYIALKNHFSSSSYNYHQYSGKTPIKVSSLEKRNDKYQFSKLAKKKHYKELLLANFVERRDMWIGDLIEEDAEQVYVQWRKKIESLTYYFKNDLDMLDNDFKRNFKIKEGQHPFLLKLYLQSQISLETLVILDSIIGFVETWDEKIREKYIWPDVSLKIKRYRDFLKINKEKCKEVFLKKFS